MISIQCTQCQAVLEIDDAFAGGVCRCQYCGTIQTVPSHLKTSSAASAAPVPASAKKSSAKALYQNKAAAEKAAQAAAAQVASAPSGLDELAQVVASSGLANSSSGLANSSGLAGSGLRSSRLTRSEPLAVAAAIALEAPVQESKKLPMLPLALGGGAALLAIAGAVVFLVLHFGHPGATGSAGDTGSGETAAPAFLGSAITSSSVIYLLDRANSLHDMFDTIRAATYQSIGSLGPGHKFAVLLWNNGGDDVAFPADAGMRSATTDQVSLLKDMIGEVPATGNSHLAGALELAKARHPGAIVIVTAKTTLDPDDTDALAKFEDAAKGKIPLTIFVIGNTDNDSLKAAAQATGGQYRRLSDHELRATVP